MILINFLFSHPHCAIATLVFVSAFVFLNSKINALVDKYDEFTMICESDFSILDDNNDRLANYTRHAHRRINNLVKRNRRLSTSVERIKTNSPVSNASSGDRNLGSNYYE
jgi:hypothetical protein